MELNSQPEAIIGRFYIFDFLIFLGPILDHCFNYEIFLCMHEWAIKMPTFLVPMCQVKLFLCFN